MGVEIVRVPLAFEHPTDADGDVIPGAHHEPLYYLDPSQKTGFQIYENVTEGTPQVRCSRICLPCESGSPLKVGLTIALPTSSRTVMRHHSSRGSSGFGNGTRRLNRSLQRTASPPADLQRWPA